jgi:uncharacterized protein YqfA (UPF0365 family)
MAADVLGVLTQPLVVALLIAAGLLIGAELQADQAEADKKIAQAKAEERRAMAVAAEQEMRARVVEAEAAVPLALAEALRSGSLGVLDHYRPENVRADTAMREAIAGPNGADGGGATPRENHR